MSRRRLDLIGQRFGRLLVLKDVGNNKQGHSQWLCRCECGTEKIVRGSDLKNKHTTSCGCLRKPKWEGQKFGKLLIIAGAGYNRWKAAQWFCRCDCGTEKIILGYNLKNGVTKSCGCLRREKMAEAGRNGRGEKNNNYKHGQTGTKALECRMSAKRRALKKNQIAVNYNQEKVDYLYSFCAKLNRIGFFKYEVDHIKPLNKRGSHGQDNMQILLVQLNQEKSDKWPLTKEEEIRYKGIILKDMK